ncbi:hypothetical protein [Roseicitreum antarcticum]|uniref:Uncharacterized protein n=1 Tax=Roseicitreum antarcticum TaxID=564137 RepID=A0A1H2W1M1_9RHOB|nr:hypothetical protein [Roseicitreum antarcticum]SDW74144.1 hypothetical protein SAMN04488238_103233 [Roseicitreum antarcticum]
MSKKQTDMKSGSSAATARETRLKAAMKANIARRKAQAAARAKGAADTRADE